MSRKIKVICFLKISKYILGARENSTYNIRNIRCVDSYSYFENLRGLVISLQFISKKRAWNIFTWNIFTQTTENTPQGRLRENSNSAWSLHSGEKKSEEYHVKGATEPLRHAAAVAIGMFYEICGILGSSGKERTVFRATSSEITVYAPPKLG